MKDILCTFLLVATITPDASAQDKALPVTEDVFSRLPDVALREDGPRRYVFTCDYLNFDIAGNLTGKERVAGNYTRALPNGMVRWNEVRISQATNFEGAFPEGQLQKYMEGFSYNPKTENEFQDSFFKGFPDQMQTKTLVWDVSMFETFAWKYFDRLKPNEPFELGASDFALPGGSFANRRPQLTWVGISERRGKMCAVIQYEAFFNKLTLHPQGLQLSGRSDYWGTIWVSLSDKQIEYGTLNEGVLLEVPIPRQPVKHTLSIFRQATFCPK